MHGVQPIAKIVPSPNEATSPVPSPTSRPPIRSARPGERRVGSWRTVPPVAPATAVLAPRSSGRHVRSSRPIVRNPGQVEAHHDEDDPADLAQEGQPLAERSAGIGRGDPKDGEHRPEAKDVGAGVAHGGPAGRWSATRSGGDCDGGELAEVGRDERQDAG